VSVTERERVSAVSLRQAAVRLEALRPEMRPLWGRMSANQMVCHLSDSLRMALGERPARVRFNRPIRAVSRWYALHTRARFPKGAPTVAQLDQERKGTGPTDFDRDLATLLSLQERFVVAVPTLGGRAHPLFGPLTPDEWLVWAWKHTDHHLRQFGL
jgi:hypothetical protein